MALSQYAVTPLSYGASRAFGGHGRDTGSDVNPDIARYNQILSDYQDKLDSGSISQGDYVNAVSKLVPEIRRTIDSYAAYGGNAINNMYRAGLSNVQTIIYKTLPIYQSGQKFLGRDLTPEEFAILKPKFADGSDVGNAYLAEYAKQQESSPEALAKKAGQFSGDVNSMFNELLQRGATKDELDYFGRALASGQTTSYQLGQYLQSLPEYQGQQDTKFRAGLQDELSNYDTQAFNREKGDILSSYAKAGLGNSSSLDFAITDALSKMQTNRDQFLGGLSAQQYGGNKQAALGAYQQSQNQYLGNLDYQRNQDQSNLNYLTQRADQGSDYQRQMNDMLNYFNSQPKQKGPGFLDYAAGIGQAALPWAYLFK